MPSFNNSVVLVVKMYSSILSASPRCWCCWDECWSRSELNCATLTLSHGLKFRDSHVIVTTRDGFQQIANCCQTRKTGHHSRNRHEGWKKSLKILTNMHGQSVIRDIRVIRWTDENAVFFPFYLSLQSQLQLSSNCKKMKFMLLNWQKFEADWSRNWKEIKESKLNFHHFVNLYSK